MILDAAQLASLGIGYHDLAGLHVPQQGGTGSVQCTALAGKHIAAAGQGADAQGPVAAGVTHCNELGGRHDHQTVGTFQHIHRLADGGLDAAHAQAVAGDEVADDLGVRGAVEDGTLVFQLAAQFNGIGQIAVVAPGHGAAAVPDDHGLCIGPHAAACRSVAHVTGGHVRIGVCQTCQHCRGEHLVHKAEVAVADNDAVIVHSDAAALLTTVLQSIQGRVGGSGHILGTGTVIDAENTAFFVQRI